MNFLPICSLNNYDACKFYNINIYDTRTYIFLKFYHSFREILYLYKNLSRQHTVRSFPSTSCKHSMQTVICLPWYAQFQHLSLSLLRRLISSSLQHLKVREELKAIAKVFSDKPSSSGCLKKTSLNLFLLECNYIVLRHVSIYQIQKLQQSSSNSTVKHCLTVDHFCIIIFGSSSRCPWTTLRAWNTSLSESWFFVTSMKSPMGTFGLGGVSSFNSIFQGPFSHNIRSLAFRSHEIWIIRELVIVPENFSELNIHVFIIWVTIGSRT